MFGTPWFCWWSDCSTAVVVRGGVVDVDTAASSAEVYCGSIDGA